MNMSRTTIGLFILTALFVLGLPARLVNGQMYEPTNLGTLGGDDGEAYALNNYGQVVGRSHNIEALTHAFHWQNDELLNLNQEVRWGRRLMQLDYGVAYDISDTDHVVGSTQCTGMLPPDEIGNEIPGGPWIIACIYRPAVMTDLTTPYPGDPLTYLGTLAVVDHGSSNASGISQNGRYVVGWSDVIPNGQIHAFLVTPENGVWAGTEVLCESSVNPLLKDLGTLLAIDESSSATAVNNAGQVVGWSYGQTNGYSAFLITPTDTDLDSTVDQWSVDANADGANDLMTDLGTLSGTNSWARDINNNAQIVGESDTSDWYTHAFMWQNGTMIDLGTLGGDDSSAAAINDSGQIVGYSINADGERRAFVIIPADTDSDGTGDQWYVDDDGDGVNDLMYDLNDLLPSGFNIRLTDARDININGEITGWGTVGSSGDLKHSAFLLTPTGAAAGTNGGTGGSHADATLSPIGGGAPSDPNDAGTGTTDTSGTTTSQSQLGPLHFLCGMGLITMLPLMLAGLCGLKIGLRCCRR